MVTLGGEKKKNKKTGLSKNARCFSLKAQKISYFKGGKEEGEFLRLNVKQRGEIQHCDSGEVRENLLGGPAGQRVKGKPTDTTRREKKEPTPGVKKKRTRRPTIRKE